MTNGVALEFRLTRSAPNSVELWYTVWNRTASDILLFLPLSKYDEQEWIPAPERAYVFWEGDLLQIAKRLMPIPSDCEVYLPEVPFLSAVGAGKPFHETMHLALPLKLDDPYNESLETSGIVEASAMVFSIGYIADGAIAMAMTDGVANAGNQLFRLDYGVAIQKQEILRTPIVATSLSVQAEQTAH